MKRMPTRPEIKAMDEGLLLRRLDDIAALYVLEEKLRFKGSQSSRRWRARMVLEAKATVETIEAELRSRAYVKEHGPYVTERMSPWAIEKRDEAFKAGQLRSGLPTSPFQKRFAEE